MSDKFASAWKGRLNTKTPLADLVRLARTDPVAKDVMYRLEEDDGVRALLFLQKTELFDGGDGPGPIYFHMYRQRGKALQLLSGSTALSRLVERRNDAALISDDFIGSIAAAAGFTPEEISRLGEDFKDVFAYIAILFLRANPSIIRLAQGERFDYAAMKKELGDYSKLDVDFMERPVSETAAIDPVIEAKVNRLGEAFGLAIAQKFEKFVEGTNDAFPSLLMAVHLASPLAIEALLARTELSYADYVDALGHLHAGGALENVSTVFWCEHCSRDHVRYDQYRGRIAPAYIESSKCRICGKPESYAALLAPAPALRELLLAKDGILGVYVGTRLAERKLAFEAGAYAGGNEFDFVVDKRHLIEVKNFKANKDEQADRNSVENALSQARETVKAAQAHGRPIDRVTIVTNFGVLEADDLKSVLNAPAYREFSKTYRVEVLEVREFEDKLSDDASL